jgi:LacI family transcriptional regulator
LPKRSRTGKQVGGKYVTQKDVADLAGVSPSIVSYVINNGPRTISEATRRRVLDAIEALDYRPNIHAQRLMLASWDSELAPRQFGVVISGDRSILLRPYYPKVLYGILEEAARQNMSMRFLMFMDELENPLNFNKLFHPEEIASAIIIAAGPILHTEVGLATINRIRERIPNLVSVGRSLPNVATVTYDLPAAMHQSTSYVLGLGHRRVAYIGTFELRIEGYRQAFHDFELEPDPDLIVEISDTNTPEHGYQSTQELIDRGALQGASPVTAIVASSDEVAWGVIHRLKIAGLQVPRDVSVIGIDNQVLSMYIDPPLTTVQLPMEQIGIEAIRVIVQRASSPDAVIPSITLPTEVIVRQSCLPYP